MLSRAKKTEKTQRDLLQIIYKARSGNSLSHAQIFFFCFASVVILACLKRLFYLFILLLVLICNINAITKGLRQ